MSLKSLNKQGFAAVEAILIVVILAIIGGTGYYVYQANNNATDTQNSAQTAANTAVPSKKKPTSDDKQSEKAAVIAVVKDYWTNKGKQVDSVTVTDIEGANAKGLFHVVGDSGGAGFIAHNDNGSWQVISTGQQKPGKDIGTKYNLPSDWYSSDY